MAVPSRRRADAVPVAAAALAERRGRSGRRSRVVGRPATGASCVAGARGDPAQADRRHLVEAQRRLQGGGRAQHHQVGVLGPDQLQPTGRPAAVRPAQTVAAGERVMLNG